MKPSKETHLQDETVCPQCGAIATWGYLGSEQTQVQVNCADCGRVEMTRAEFDVAEAELPGPSDD